MYGVKVGYWDVNGAICGGERASERERARASSLSVAGSKSGLRAGFKARASEEGRANAPRYQRPWTRFTSGVFAALSRVCSYCTVTRAISPSRRTNRTHEYTETFRKNMNTMIERGTDDRCVFEKNKLIPWSRTDQVNRTNFIGHITLPDDSSLSGHSAPNADRTLYAL